MEEIKKEVRKKISTLFNDTKDSKRIWRSHISKVVDYSIMLSIKLGANTDVCEVSAWLHDVAKMEKVKGSHHIKGAARAREILLELSADENFIKDVEACIITHSSDKNYEPKTLNQKIVAASDALAFFDDFLLFVYGLVYIKKLPDKKVKDVLIEATKTAWYKASLLVDSKKLSEKKYLAIMHLLKEEGLR